MIVAINHPYFFPYAGFFRLMAHADVFVALDTAQFPRRGYVHRNKLLNRLSEPRWLTLPLKKQSRDVFIKDIRFADDAKSTLAMDIRRFPALESTLHGVNRWKDELLELRKPPAELVLAGLSWVNETLGFKTPILRASELQIDPDLTGEDRILAILKHLGASAYINAPGGAHLYNEPRFKEIGVGLNILRHFEGDHASILQRLAHEDRETIINEIESQILWQR